LPLTDRFNRGLHGAAAVLLALLLAASGGCTRSSDGTIEPVVKLDVPVYSVPPIGGWKVRNRPAEIRASRFPPPPSRPAAVARAEREKALRRYARAKLPRMKVVAPVAPAKADAAAKPLTCTNVKNAAGRVKVVCE
jgi:hypothetical protein